MNAKKAKLLRKMMEPKRPAIYETINHPKLVKQPDGTTAVMFVTQRVHKKGTWMAEYKRIKRELK